MKGGPKEGIALVFGAPKEAPTPAGPEMEEEEGEDYETLARMAFPTLAPEDINADALKEFVMACMGK